MKLLLVTPPFTQLNTPYPATAYLKGFCNSKNIESNQCDLGIEVILEIFSSSGLTKLFSRITDDMIGESVNIQRMVSLQGHYIQTIDNVIQFLQNKNHTLAYAICDGDYLPEAGRFEQLEELDWAFGTMGIRDKARHLATLYLEDLSDLIKETVDPHFGFSRYAERISLSANSFDELENNLNQPLTFTDQFLVERLENQIKETQPDVLCISIPFPGNLFGALRCGQYIKQNHPKIKVHFGGGYPNTELRSISDPRVFKYVDFISLDDGEMPLLNLIDHLQGNRPIESLKRTFSLLDQVVIYSNGSPDLDVSQRAVGTPDYADLLLDQYLSVIEIANPMHRMWSDGRWNKLTLAHGCYWGKCSFCDITLNYIKDYEPVTAALICDRIEEIIAQTGENGFHFVDEAAPPALMRDVAIEILNRKLSVVWWTNIRFEKSFSADLCRLLKASGCIAVSGGLEVASDRLLTLMEKGVTVSQVSTVAKNFTESGILVHAYLMYGFPTQTAQETIDALEIVRQLFMNGVVHSGFWHQFAMTAHSPVGKAPEKYHVINKNETLGAFANNDLVHEDPKGTEHELFSEGLRKSLFNYMHGVCFEFELDEWFDFEVPPTMLAPDFIESVLMLETEMKLNWNAKVVWIGNKNPILETYEFQKKGKTVVRAKLVFHNLKEDFILKGSVAMSQWIIDILSDSSVQTLSEWKTSFEQSDLGDFEFFLESQNWLSLRDQGLLLL